MKTKLIPFTMFALFFSLKLFAAPEMERSEMDSNAFNLILGALELPFLGVAIVFSFLTAKQLRGGKFGSGMAYLAWGFLVMAVGHLHMQIHSRMGLNIFNELLGITLGKTAWFAALIVTWGLSSVGFYKIYKASKI